MGQGQSQGQGQSPDLSIYATKTELVNQLKSYVRSSQLTSTRTQILEDIDKIYAKNTQLESYISKTELIKELDKYALKTDLNNTKNNIDKNFINKINDKAKYSEATINNNDTYTTPLYWSERYVANRSSLQETDDNEQKYVTPKFLSERKKSWIVTTETDNEFTDISDDKFPTAGWTTSKINKEKQGWTVSSSNDKTLQSTDDIKFVTPSWTNNKIIQQRNAFAVSFNNDRRLQNNDDSRFPTVGWTNAKLQQQKNEWTVNTTIDKKLESIDDIKFITPAWATAKIDQQKSIWTISALNDKNIESTDDVKFPTVGWTNSKMNKEKSNWTISLENDGNLENTSDNKFATVAWINKKIDTNKANLSISVENNSNLDSIADDKLTTAKWTTEKLKQQRNEWTTSFANDSTLSSKDDNKFTTPEWVNKKMDNFIPRKPEDDSSDNKFVTTKYLTEIKSASDSSHTGSRLHLVTPFYLDNVWFLNKKAQITDSDNTSNTEKYVTPDFITKRMNSFMQTSQIQINTTTEASLANRIAGNSNFVDKMANVLKDDEKLQKGISDVMTNIDNVNFNRNNTEYLSSKITENLLSSGNDRYLLVDSVANRLANEYKNELTRDIGSSAVRIDTLRLKLGQSVTQLANPFQTSQENTQNLITAGKFGFSDAELGLTVGSGSNNPFIDTKNSYLELRGGARAYKQGSSTIRQKRRVKIFDDLLVDNKVAIGSNVDTLTDDPNNPIDKYQLKVGGPTLFTEGVDITRGNLNITGNINLQNDWKIDTSNGKFIIYKGNDIMFTLPSS